MRPAGDGTDLDESTVLTESPFAAWDHVRPHTAAKAQPVPARRTSGILEPGDTISGLGGRQVAKDKKGDLRKLEAASLTLGALASIVDRGAPRVEILAAPGSPDFKVLVWEPNLLHNELAGSEYMSFAMARRGQNQIQLARS